MINDIIYRLPEEKRGRYMCVAYFIGSVVFFVCPLLYVLFLGIPKEVLGKSTDDSKGIMLLIAGRVIMSAGIIIWAFCAVYLMASGSLAYLI